MNLILQDFGQRILILPGPIFCYVSLNWAYLSFLELVLVCTGQTLNIDSVHADLNDNVNPPDVSVQFIFFHDSLQLLNLFALFFFFGLGLKLGYAEKLV